ncbi:MAG: hypothetical protein JXX28_01710 [Deltaproteobacteria bacterium]|nr:hypothetical protein [Deltaproteobacteria bacterium]
MSLHADWLVLCEQVLADQHTGQLSLMNCLEQVSAPSFPAHHPRFAVSALYRWSGDPPESAVPLSYRLIRQTEVEGEEVLVELPGEWRAGTRTARVYVNVQVLRLRRAEEIRFRLDHRIGEEDWQTGPVGTLRVDQLPSPRPLLREEPQPQV